VPSRWERGLLRFKEVEVPVEAIDRRTRQGARTHVGDGQPSRRGRVVSAVAAFAIFATAISLFVVPALRGSDRPVSATYTSAPVVLDPEVVCKVPPSDRSVSLLVGERSVEYPTAVLEGSGQPASALEGPATDALREYIASSAGRNAPATGWRVIATSADAVTFAAPPGYGVGDWWVVGFARRDGMWQRVEEEIVDQEQTPAQQGQGMSLRWTGDAAVRDGGWTSPLELVNGRQSTWTGTGGYWGLAHVFDPTTGDEIGSAAYWPAGPAQQITLESNEARTLPLALGGSLDGLRPGRYPVIACVPQLGLASSVGTIDVAEDFATAGTHVLTYESNGMSMDALAGGVLGTKNGCLGLGTGNGFSYLIFPVGYQLVERDGKDVLIGPTGEGVATMGETASFGGGFSSIDATNAHIVGGVPGGCIGVSAGYFIVGA
jgi:hypothetical protein